MENNYAENTQYKFNCDICDFHSSNKFDYSRHIKTKKHIGKTDALKNVKGSKFTCDDCSKGYNCYSGLWKHKKKCCNIEYFNSDSEEEQIGRAHV